MAGTVKAALRWGLAGAIAATVTAGLFLAMAGLTDGSWLLEQLIRVFELSQTQLDPEERCRIGPPREAEAVLIEGSVGTTANGRFVPRDDAEVRIEHGVGAKRPIDVGPDGSFRFVVSLPEPGPPECRGTTVTPQVLIRAEGCHERRVPVTRAWLSRRILLSCPSRS